MFTKYYFCLLLAVGLSQAHFAPLHVPLEPMDLIHDLLDRLKDLLNEAELIVNSLESSLADGGKALIDRANGLIETALNVVEGVIATAGQCGQAAVPDVDKAKNDAEEAVKQCVSVAATEATPVLEELKPLLENAKQLDAEVEEKIDACNAGAEPVVCLAGVALTEGPKVEALIEQIVPLVSKVVQVEADVDDCITQSIITLEGDVERIINDIRNCENGGN